MNYLDADLLIALALLALAGLALLLLPRALRWLNDHVGEWAADLVLALLRAGLRALDAIVARTPSAIDDLALAELRRRLDDIEARLHG